MGVAMELAEDVAGIKDVTVAVVVVAVVVVVDAVAVVGTSFAGIRTRYFEEYSRYGLAIADVWWSVGYSRCERGLVGASLSGIDLELWCRTQFPSVPVPVKCRLEPRRMCSHRLTGAADRTTR